MTALYLGFNPSHCKEITPQDYHTWIPPISPELMHLNFNVNAFYPTNPAPEPDRPISWILFNDPNGDGLECLAQISVWVFNDRPIKICFVYKSGNRTESKTFEPDWNGGPSQKYRDSRTRCKEVFDIDGIGGERISMVKAVFYGKATTPQVYKVSI